MNKAKRMLILMLAFVMIGTNVYATVRINANKTSMQGSKQKWKSNKKDYALITITGGVEASRCQVYIRVADKDSCSIRKTKQRLFSGNVTDSKLSYGTGFTEASYCYEYYKMYAQLPTTAYYNTTTVVGDFTP